MRKLPRLIVQLFCLLFIAVVVYAAVYGYDRGFSSKWRDFVQEELSSRGLEIDFKRLTIDPAQGLVAREVRLYDNPSRSKIIASIDQINLDADLTKMLAGQDFINSMKLKDANLSLPLNPENEKGENLNIENISARFLLSSNRFEARELKGKLGDLDFEVIGDLLLPSSLPQEGSEQAEPSNSRHPKQWLEEMKKRRQFLSKTINFLKHFKAVGGNRALLTLEVSGPIDDLLNLSGNAKLSTGAFTYHEVPFSSLQATAFIENGILEISPLKISDAGGELIADARFPIENEKGEVDFQIQSSIGLSKALKVLQKKTTNPALENLQLTKSPSLNLKGSFNIYDYFAAQKTVPTSLTLEDLLPHLKTTGQLSAKNLLYKNKQIDSLSCDYHIDGSSYYLRNGTLSINQKKASFQILNQEEGCRAKLNLPFNPSLLADFIKSEKLSSLREKYRVAEGSDVSLILDYQSSQLGAPDYHCQGNLEVDDLLISDVPFDKVSSDFVCNSEGIDFSNLSVTRQEGRSKIDLLRILPYQKLVQFKNFKGSVFIADIFSPYSTKIANKLRKYRFQKAPQVEINGIIDYSKNRPKLDLNCQFKSNNPLSLDFLGKEITFDGAAGSVRVLPKKVITKARGSLYSGQFSLDSEYFGLGTHRSRATGKNISFARLSKIYFNNPNTEGSFSIDCQLSRQGKNPRNLKGSGKLELLDGDLFSVPFLGLLSKPLSEVFQNTKAGYSKANEASANFTISDGKIRTNNFAALTPAFRLEMAGDIFFIEDRVDLDSTLKLRGAPGFFLSPVTNLFLQFKGQGSMNQTEWKSKTLPGAPNRAIARGRR